MAPAYKFLTVESAGGVATVLIDKPPVNVLDESLYAELLDVADAVDGDPKIRAVVFASRHPKIFIAGADIKEMQTYRFEREWVEQKIRRVHSVFDRLEDITRPTIAAITGHALGGGCEFALAMDFRFMSRGRAQIGLPEIDLGIVPGGGGTLRLPRAVGYPQALELIMIGRRLDADEAERIGLVHRACEPERTLAQAQEFAEILARQAPVAISLVKQCLRKTWGAERDVGMREELEHCLRAVLSADAREGIAAFVEKRKAHWSGR